jgi:Fe-S cluster assembly ATP-binding protein
VSVLEISGLRAGIGAREILKGIDLTVSSGEVHAVMGPNGSGKSTLAHVLMGRPGYEVKGGSARLDGRELLGLPTWRRAQAGLFLAMQYPVEVPGVSMEDALEETFVARGGERGQVAELLRVEAERIGFRQQLLTRFNETLQLGVLRPRFAVLDEIDSGLDIDALRAVSRRIEAATSENDLGVLAITHYSRILHELRPDVVHVLSEGRIVASGGPELAQELEQTGYAAYGIVDPSADEAEAVSLPGDPFADPLG